MAGPQHQHRMHKNMPAEYSRAAPCGRHRARSCVKSSLRVKPGFRTGWPAVEPQDCKCRFPRCKCGPLRRTSRAAAEQRRACRPCPRRKVLFCRAESLKSGLPLSLWTGCRVMAATSVPTLPEGGCGCVDFIRPRPALVRNHGQKLPSPTSTATTSRHGVTRDFFD
jgi:hypothetical protein